MAIAFFQKIIDKLRNKQTKILLKEVEYLKQILNEQKKEIAKLKSKFGQKKENLEPYIIGNNNHIYSQCIQTQDSICTKLIQTKFKLEGNNNYIVFCLEDKHIQSLPSGLDIKVKGNNNYIEIHQTNFINSRIYIGGDDNKFILQRTSKFVEGAYFCIEQGSTLIIEENCEIGNGKLRVIANGDYKNKHKILIGKGTHIAHDVIIRNSDGECLIDKDTQKPLSEPKDIIIGEHCWITTRCIILKNAYLPNGTIVGANSLVNKKFETENTLIAGSPAKVIKNGVFWKVGSYGVNMELYDG